MVEIDARGLSCPQPVMLVQRAVKAHTPVTMSILVDDPCAVENITRYGSNNGYRVAHEAQGGGAYKLALTKEA